MDNQYLTKLRITSPYELIIICLLVIAIISVIINYNKIPTSVYKSENKAIIGTITSCQKAENGYRIKLKAKEKIIVNYYNDFNCKLGIKIKTAGELKKPSSATIFNLFDYQKYLLSEKINYTFNAKKINVIDNNISIIYKIKNMIQDKIDNYKSKDYLNAFILGNSKDIEDDILNSYRFNGISHLLAISGMHITLLSSFILFLLNIVSKNKKINYFIVILCLVFYTFLTNFTPSVLRASLLFIVLTINKIFKLKIDTIYLLILIMAAFLIYNPYMIYNIGFLFSFTISFFLIIFNDFINRFKNYFIKTLIVSIIAFLASIPIMINNFFSINLLSPLINIIFVPLVSIIIYPLALLTLFLPFLDDLLLNLTIIMENISLSISKISFLNITLKHINILVFILYYVIIIYSIYKLTKNKITGILILIITLVIHNNINHLEKYPTMTMIDVGQGDCILIKLPHNEGNILIDTGGEVKFNNQKPYDLANKKIIPYLKSEGIKQIDYLILTHGDFDHAGMAPNLINNFKIKEIILNKSKDNSLEKNIINLAQKKKIKVQKISEKTLKINKYRFEFLGGPVTSNENDDSLIIYTNIGTQNILLMGDASERRENNILNTYNLDYVDILKVGHHGSKTSTSPKLIQEVRPKISLISAGKNNLYGHPHKETLERLENSKILITQIDGSVKLTLKKRIIYNSAR